MANQKRTEVSLKLGQKTYTLRASYEVISIIETHMDMAIMQILHLMGNGALKATDAAFIIYSALQPLHADAFEEGGVFAVESNESVEAALGETLFRLGTEKYLVSLMDLVAIAVTGNRLSKQVEAKAKKSDGKK